jgi:hypothetical protein
MTRASVLLLCLCGLIAAVLPCAAIGQTPTQDRVPDLTGTWQPENDPSAPPWHFTASDNLQTLDATWSGNPAAGHGSLTGSFHGTYANVESIGPNYHGNMTVTEGGNPPVSGTMDIQPKYGSTNEIYVVYDQENGVRGNLTFMRTSPAPPEPPPAPRYGNDLGLPPNDECIGKDKFTFTLQQLTGMGPIVEVDVFINDVPTATKTGDSITNLTIGKLPKSGRFVVKIVAIYANGAQWASQQTYKRCKKKKRRS